VLRAQLEELARDLGQIQKWADGLIVETQRLQGIEQRLGQAEELACQDLIDKNALTIRLASMEEQRDEAQAKLAQVVAALEQIAKGEGRYNRDPFIHAANTVEDMIALATAALGLR
jgi:hypothetical protein